MRQNIVKNICSLMNGDIPTELTSSDWQDIVRVARCSSVLPRIAANQKLNFNGALPDYVIEQFNAGLKHSELLETQVFFEAHDLNLNISKCSSQPAIFLKGAAYVLSLGSVGKGRTFSDIDILVNKADLPNIEKRLKALAWFSESVSDYDEKYYREWAHEVPPLIRAGRGTVVDIHHNLIPPISGKAPDIKLFLEGLRKVDSGYYILSAHAMTLHSIIHLFYQEEFIHGFRDLSDLHLLFTENNEDPTFYPELLKLADETKFGVELFYACRYLQSIIGTKVNDTFLSNLSKYKPSSLKLLVSDWMFSRILIPRHSLVNKAFTSLAHQMAFIRGHKLKMPFNILCIHTFNKIKFSVEHFLTGKNKAEASNENKLW
ncbi:nucleotidyltransferase family protein [Paraglaciecola aquimarina]|uniref:Nucleotidyltransferase family protein n=1 Tax=Paraglaciecola algarum TaxID=3050085 RepID=A0ABS9D7T1_9ALTE|nr:nucleotidyltransferase family protein [Paraglaciecola sp. G1-23]MCF2947726.1 nucleotidyltransferase family protein [Paraglaciecola sp. G1-23]